MEDCAKKASEGLDEHEVVKVRINAGYEYCYAKLTPSPQRLIAMAMAEGWISVNLPSVSSWQMVLPLTEELGLDGRERRRQSLI